MKHKGMKNKILRRIFLVITMAFIVLEILYPETEADFFIYQLDNVIIRSYHIFFSIFVIAINSSYSRIELGWTFLIALLLASLFLGFSFYKISTIWLPSNAALPMISSMGIFFYLWSKYLEKIEKEK